MSIDNHLSGDSPVNIQISDDIKRLKDGSIDYNYYSSIGRHARNMEIKAISDTILNLSMRSMKILPVVTVLIILNFVL
jgi:hypothetical protein